TYRKWAADTPDGFVFSVKGPRFTTNRRVLGEAGDSLKHFFDSGVGELGSRLGPLLWQFPPTKKFDPEDFEAFLALLPKSLDGHDLRHVVEVRHASFCVPEFIALLRKYGIAVVFAEHETYPAIADVTADFVYLRLQKGEDTIDTGYPPPALDAWAERLKLPYAATVASGSATVTGAPVCALTCSTVTPGAISSRRNAAPSGRNRPRFVMTSVAAPRAVTGIVQASSSRGVPSRVACSMMMKTFFAQAARSIAPPMPPPFAPFTFQFAKSPLHATS
ncbi:MAG: DUF72 domain-containing protein, partial [Rhodospirillales bacterium]|nr:DUF72 domain-containing protein [Rhodospirillales bacterium]